MALWPNTRSDILGRQPVGISGYLAFQETAQRTQRGLAYFAGEQVEETSSVPEGAFPGAAIIAPLESGGMSTSISGSGQAGGPAIMALLAVASLAGGGGVTALGGLIVNLAATIAGSGGVSSAAVQAFLNLLATISGSGGASGTGTGIGDMDATVTGQGSTASTATGIGAMGATLRGYGELTPEGLRDAVWSAIANSYTTTGTMGAKLNSAASGGVDYLAMAEAVRTELAAELARLDAAISSRQASGAVVDADVRYVNGVEIGGTGTPGDTWGPA